MDETNFDCIDCGRTYCTENDTGDKSEHGMCNHCTKVYNAETAAFEIEEDEI
tara:strand:- start:322 stop:477 length:156 start_codon:yes stop_codon:yes gene_type:complete